jgi:hypothetical protein
VRSRTPPRVNESLTADAELPDSRQSRPSTMVKDSSDACPMRDASGPDMAGGRRWIILQGGNRGIVLERSAAGRAYGDLSD